MKRRVGIIQTGTSNIASLEAALERAGAESCIINSPEDLCGHERLVLPGVGSFGSAIAELDRLKLREPLLRMILSGTPLLAICLGMQLLFEESEESGGVLGLGVLRGRLVRFKAAPRIPHVGWNKVNAPSDSLYLRPGYAYFVHSYCLSKTSEAITASSTSYYESFISAFEYRNILACQFHPELSGAWGGELLSRWLDTSNDQSFGPDLVQERALC